MRLLYKAIFCVVVIFLLCSELSAQGRIAVVNLQRVLSQSVVGKAAKSNLKREVEKREKKLASGKQELKRMRGEIEKQGALLSESALDDKAQALRKKEREYARTVQDEKEALGRLNQKEVGKVLKQAMGVVQRLAKKEGYEVVLEHNPQFVVYAQKEIDITEQVVKILDKDTTGM